MQTIVDCQLTVGTSAVSNCYHEEANFPFRFMVIFDETPNQLAPTDASCLGDDFVDVRRDDLGRCRPNAV